VWREVGCWVGMQSSAARSAKPLAGRGNVMFSAKCRSKPRLKLPRLESLPHPVRWRWLLRT
jgi:hypothetical protein